MSSWRCTLLTWESTWQSPPPKKKKVNRSRRRIEMQNITYQKDQRELMAWKQTQAILYSIQAPAHVFVSMLCAGCELMFYAAFLTPLITVTSQWQSNLGRGVEADNEYIGTALLSGHTFQLQNRKKKLLFNRHACYAWVLLKPAVCSAQLMGYKSPVY